MHQALPRRRLCTTLQLSTRRRCKTPKVGSLKHILGPLGSKITDLGFSYTARGETSDVYGADSAFKFCLLPCCSNLLAAWHDFAAKRQHHWIACNLLWRNHRLDSWFGRRRALNPGDRRFGTESCYRGQVPTLVPSDARHIRLRRLGWLYV